MRKFVYALGMVGIICGSMWLYGGRAGQELINDLKKIAERIDFVWYEHEELGIRADAQDFFKTWLKRTGENKAKKEQGEFLVREIITEPLDKHMEYVQDNQVLIKLAEKHGLRKANTTLELEEANNAITENFQKYLHQGGLKWEDHMLAFDALISNFEGVIGEKFAKREIGSMGRGIDEVCKEQTFAVAQNI